MFHVRVLNLILAPEDVYVCSPTLFHDRRSYLWISGPESAEKRILAITTFVRALKEVATEVDDDDDPQDAIKEYGKQLVKSLTLIGIGEAAGIGRIARKRSPYLSINYGDRRGGTTKPLPLRITLNLLRLARPPPWHHRSPKPCWGMLLAHRAQYAAVRGIMRQRATLLILKWGQ